jgi:non-ribosomal peptide synthetase component F
LTESVGYWKQQLDGAPVLLELPTDLPRPARQTGRISTGERELPLESSESIATLAIQLSTTEESILLAAVAVLLRRYSRQEDIVLGYNKAGLSLPLIPLRIQLGDDLSLRDLVQKVDEIQTEAIGHTMPLAELVKELGLHVDESYHPICQVAFSSGASSASGANQNERTFDLVFNADQNLRRLRIHWRRTFSSAKRLKEC